MLRFTAPAAARAARAARVAAPARPRLLWCAPGAGARAPLRAAALAAALPPARRYGTQPPESTDRRDLQSNELAERLPKFPLHKDVVPALLPKADTPRVGPHLTFAQLMARLREAPGPELVYMAESHRLWFVACFAFAFIAAYNVFDVLDAAVPRAFRAWQDNELAGTPMENLGQLVRRFGLAGALTGIYALFGITMLTIPTRLVRRIEYVPGRAELVRLVTHPLLPGRPSPVVTLPLANLSIGRRSKVWTGDGFYGTASKSSFFFLLWEEGRRLPWIVDRSGWFWGDGRVYDVLFGKEPVALAETGLSYDDALRQQMHVAERNKAKLRRELGPAWRAKATAQLVKEDVQRFSALGRAAVLGSRKKGGLAPPPPAAPPSALDRILNDKQPGRAPAAKVPAPRPASPGPVEKK